MNPEFTRNMWLELTPVRRWATPFVLLLLVLFVELLDEAKDHFAPNWPGYMILGLGMYCLFAVWGSWRGANSVVSEVVGSTWDLQRLSQQRPFDLLVGKLLGSTLFEALLAYLGVAMYAVGALASNKVEAGELLLQVAAMLLGLWLLLACAMIMSLVTARGMVVTRRPTRPSFVHGLGIFLMLSFTYSVVGSLFEKHEGPATVVHWWWELSISGFVPLSLGMFLFWALLLGHRMVRAELQEQVGPWSWLAFLAFLTLYLFPLLPREAAVQLGSTAALLFATAAGVCASFVPPLLLGEPKDLVRLRSLVAAFRRGDTQGVLTQLPLWSLALAGFVLWLVALGVAGLVKPGSLGVVPLGVGLSVLLFMLRDVAWILTVHFSSKLSRHPEWVVVFFIFLLYGLLPGVVGLAMPELTFLLTPTLPWLKEGAGPGQLPGLVPVLWALPGLLISLAIAIPKLRQAFKP